MEYKEGDRVGFVSQFNNMGQFAPGQKCSGKIIKKVCNPPESTVYRIELDMPWGKRVQEHSWGRKIVVGNVYAGSISLLVE